MENRKLFTNVALAACIALGGGYYLGRLSSDNVSSAGGVSRIMENAMNNPGAVLSDLDQRQFQKERNNIGPVPEIKEAMETLKNLSNGAFDYRYVQDQSPTLKNWGDFGLAYIDMYFTNLIAKSDFHNKEVTVFMVTSFDRDGNRKTVVSCNLTGKDRRDVEGTANVIEAMTALAVKNGMIPTRSNNIPTKAAAPSSNVNE